MRRVSPLLLFCLPALAHAVLPVYNTDLVTEGEVLGSAYISYTQPEADTTAVISGGQFAGHTKTETGTTAVQLAYGIGRRLSGYIATSYVDSTQKATLAGPANVTFESGTRGWGDLNATLEYLAFDDAVMPVVARLSVSVPTASDMPAQSGTVVNGVQVTAKEVGGPGRGQTAFAPQLAGSVKGPHDALEWTLYWQTDDDKDTEDAYQATLGWVHDFTPETYMRLSGTAYFQHGMNAHGETTSDMNSYAAGATIAHQLGKSARVSVSYNYFRPDSVHAAFSNGNVIDQRNQTSQQGSLGIVYLFD